AMSGIEMLHVAWQAPLQQTSLPVHTLPPHLHCPPEQVWPLSQTLPHMPQLRRSFMRSAQPPIGQQVCVIAQGAPDGKQPHLPPMHTVPPVQAALQPPQLLRSTEVLRHFSPQHVPWQFSGWFGQMSPPPFMSFGTLVLELLQLVTRIKANSR